MIWGAGGHGKVVLDIARSTANFDTILFADEDQTKENVAFQECEVVTDCTGLYRFAGSHFVIAIGNNHIRAQRFCNALAYGLLPATLVHKSTFVSPTAKLGPGTVVMPGAIINAGALIGENCIINSGAIVEHDCQVGASVHISPKAALGGGAVVGTLAHIGMGAVVLPNASVGEESIVGAGAVVLKVAPARCTVVGIPAKVIHRRT